MLIGLDAALFVLADGRIAGISGLGSCYGAGCTSGHRICGLARLWPRSLVATICLMTTGFLTVFVVRHILTAIIP